MRVKASGSLANRTFIHSKDNRLSHILLGKSVHDSSDSKTHSVMEANLTSPRDKGLQIIASNSPDLPVSFLRARTF